MIALQFHDVIVEFARVFSGCDRVLDRECKRPDSKSRRVAALTVLQEASMQIKIPSTEFRDQGRGLAKRPASLAGAKIGFLDGWGFREPDGTISMYPLMRELRQLLAERVGTGDIVWHKKKNVAQRSPKDELKELFSNCTVVINGEAA
jgi:hypothetical protein